MDSNRDYLYKLSVALVEQATEVFAEFSGYATKSTDLMCEGIFRVTISYRVKDPVNKEHLLGLHGKLVGTWFLYTPINTEDIYDFTIWTTVLAEDIDWLEKQIYEKSL